MDSVRSLLPRFPRPSRRTRLLLPAVAGVIAGVALIATGLALVQLAGAAAIGFALLVARGTVRVADAWWSDPGGELLTAGRTVRQRIPVWAWRATVATLIGIAALVMLRQLLRGDPGARTLGDLGKGVIALLMMASLALWGADGLPRRFWRRAGGDEMMERRPGNPGTEAP